MILEPRSRTVDAELLLESLYRLTDLEVRFPLNLNVLDANRTPLVMSLKEALSSWLAFQFQVLVRRSEVRIGKIDDRLELLDGFLIAFLNLDRVIAIIRGEDEPKPVLMARVLAHRPPGRSDPQHAAAQLAQARGDGDRPRARRAGQGARGARQADRKPGPPAHPAEEGPGSGQGQVRRRAPHPAGGSGGPARGRLVGDDREGADHRHPVAARLDPGDARACRAGGDRRDQVARGRRAVHPFPRADHRQDSRSSPPTAGSTRLAATSFRAGAASASRCGCRSTSSPRSRSSR